MTTTLSTVIDLQEGTITLITLTEYDNGTFEFEEIASPKQ